MATAASLPRLGLKPKRIDSRTLKLSNFVSLARLPAPPDYTSWRSKVGNWPMLLNDQLGDCGPAAACHQIQGWTADIGTPYVPVDADALSAYQALSGYDPNTGMNDNGVVLLDEMNFWRQNGIASRKILAYADATAHDPQGNVTIDHVLMCTAIWLFGSVMLGVQLPMGVQGASQWMAPSRYHRWGRWAPGSWGGHAVPAVDFDANWVYVVTWGGIMQVSWAFMSAYCNEAYAPLSPDCWVAAAGQAPNGFALDALIQDMKAITG